MLTNELETCLVQRAATGDADAFGELIARHRTSALRVATVVLGTVTGADDAVQDAAIRAWRARASIDPSRGFRSWYLRVVANAARNGVRSGHRRTALELRQASAMPRDLHAPDPADLAVTDAERQVVIAALNRLGHLDRLVIALRHFEQLTEPEMAEVLDCRPGTVKSRLSRAMARLRKQLDAPGPAGHLGPPGPLDPGDQR